MNGTTSSVTSRAGIWGHLAPEPRILDTSVWRTCLFVWMVGKVKILSDRRWNAPNNVSSQISDFSTHSFGGSFWKKTH